MPNNRLAGAYLVKIPVAARMGTYACHQRVYEACGREIRPLWRRTPEYLLAVSRRAPDGLDSRAYAPAPREGLESRFDLLAEIAVAKKRRGEERGRRCDPIFEAHLAQPKKSYAELAEEFGRPWLDRQGKRLGFEVLSLDRPKPLGRGEFVIGGQAPSSGDRPRHRGTGPVIGGQAL